MKKGKYLLFSGLIAISLLLTGCSPKETKLVCTQNQNGVDIVFNIGFKDDKVFSMDFDYNMDLSSYNDTQIDAISKQDFCEIVKNSMSAYKNAFTSCNQKIESKELKVSSILDVDKITESEKEKMGTPEATKEELEQQGYSCTIK